MSTMVGINFEKIYVYWFLSRLRVLLSALADYWNRMRMRIEFRLNELAVSWS